MTTNAVILKKAAMGRLRDPAFNLYCAAAGSLSRKASFGMTAKQRCYPEEGRFRPGVWMPWFNPHIL